jgi:hypothetical protein
MIKYKDVFNMMLEQNKEEFDQFKKLHDEFAANPDLMQEKYNSEGKKIMTIVKHYEDILCGHSEGSGYGSFSGNLAEKFQNEVRKKFPKFDHIGVKTFNISKLGGASK